MLQHVRTAFHLIAVCTALVGAGERTKFLVDTSMANIDRISPDLRPKGKPVALAKWMDKSGVRMVIITEFVRGEACEPGYVSELYAREITFADSTESIAWKVQDFSGNPCETVFFVEHSLKVLDIDGDSIAETRFIYEFGHDCCDPTISKYMLHYRGVKLAIRGSIPMQGSGETKAQRCADAAFDKYPALLKNFALKDWDKYAGGIPPKD